MHLVIAGSGVIGLSTAWYAQQRGHKVTLIDRSVPEDAGGCSFGNAGMVVPSHFVPLAAPGMVALGLKWMWNPESPFYIKPRLDFGLMSWAWKFMRAATPAHVEKAAPLIRDLSLASRAAFEELSLQGDFGLVKNGLLMLCKEARTLDEEGHTAEKARQLGVPAEVLDAAATAAIDPGVRMDVAGSVYFPLDCHLSPSRFIASLRQRLEDGGATFLTETEITGWRRSGRKVEAVQTSRGDVTGDEFLLCGGSWSPTIARDLPVSLPMQAGKGYSVTVPNPRQLPRLCSIFTEARVAVTPMDGTLRFGGTMEIAGLNTDINPVRVQGILKAVPKYFPDFQPSDFTDLPVWRGLRPCSPDGMPYLGRFAACDNLSTATGHAMMGLSLAPVTGQIMARLLSGEAPGFDLTLMSPDRYA